MNYSALIIIAYGIMLVGGIMILIAAFRESVLWGLGCLFIPIVGLIFVLAHWREAKAGFLIQLFGLAVLLLATMVLHRPLL